MANRSRQDDYLVLATTQLGLQPQEIIQLYARRWQIENYFKVAKQYLRLDKSQVQNYDGLCGHLARITPTYVGNTLNDPRHNSIYKLVNASFT